MLIRISATFSFLLLIFSNTVIGEEIRDYYSEPGLNPFKEEMLDLNEAIDPFSGTLQQKYVDLHLPGNGGLDITVNRVYTSRQDYAGLGTKGTAGLGWSMHFGRIVVPTDHYNKLCSQQSFAVSTADNPSIEFPDGGRELLVLSDFHTDETLITKSNWKADCKNRINQTGMRVTAPDGTIYYMDKEEYTQDQYSWYTSRIEDVHGNTIDIVYSVNASGILYIDEVSASDGRYVDFKYLNEADPTILLSEIEANNHSIYYNYSPLVGAETTHRQLIEVVRPDNLSWQYTYYPELSAEVGGSHSLHTVTYPHGGQMEYAYQLVRFEPTQRHYTTAIKSKSISGPDIDLATWSYQFIPSTGIGIVDRTIVTIPGGSIEYEHQGYLTGGAAVWPIGLLWQKSTYDQGGILQERIINQWDKRVISQEGYWHGRSKVGDYTYAPVLLWSFHSNSSDARGITTNYNGYDEYGNPLQISEESSIQNQPNKVTDISYINDTENWLIGLKENETISGIGTISHEYYAGTGDVKKITTYGIPTNFTYTLEGDLESETNARGYQKRYSLYHRGVARHEEYDVDTGRTINIDREVNDSGTVKSLTKGNRFTTNFSYDGLNRLSGIQFPINQGVTVDYALRSKVLTRGDYQERTTLDGYGRAISFERKDLATAESIVTTTEYDAFGRKTFLSYPNSLLGTRYQYDVIGRETKVTHGDGSYSTKEYGMFYPTQDGGFIADVKSTDERGYVTYILETYYGSYNKSYGPWSIYTQENATVIVRNQLGNPTQVYQGVFDESTQYVNNPVFRTYYYNQQQLLYREEDPETGISQYGYDEVGNRVWSKVADSEVTRNEYDGLNRLITTDYPEGTADIAYVYDDNSNLKSLTKGITEWTYNYDQNDNLIKEILLINDDVEKHFELSYDRNLLDYINSLTYPTGNVVNYSPDAFGRPTQVTGFVNSVVYHPNGQLASFEYANGIVTNITLNDNQLVETIGAVTPSQLSISDYVYGYDEATNVSSIQNRLSPENNLSLDYDAIGRLTIANGSWGDGALSYNHYGDILNNTLGDEVVTRSYSSDTKRLQQIWHLTSNGNDPSTVHSIEYVDYDVYGNITNISDALGGDVARSFTYDAASNLVEAVNDKNSTGPISYMYDGNGQAVSEEGKSFKAFKVTSKSGEMLFEHSIDDCKDTTHIYLGGFLVAKNQIPSTVDNNFNGVEDCLEYDLDNDGLSAQEELAINTDPLSQDTDGDGIPDGYERDNQLNPLVNSATGDADNDGVQNLEEYIDNTDVNDPTSFENKSPIATDDYAVLSLDISESPLGMEGVYYDIYTQIERSQSEFSDYNVQQVVAFSDNSALVMRVNSGASVSALRVDSKGYAVGSRFELFADSEYISSVRVARLQNDSFVMVWTGGDYGHVLYGRVFDKHGNAITNKFAIAQNSDIGYTAGDPTPLLEGGFVVTWSEYHDPYGAPYGTGIVFRKYDDLGNALTEPVTVQEEVEARRFTNPVTEQLDDGTLVVGWKKQGAYYTYAGYYRLFQSDLSPLSDRVQFINSGSFSDLIALSGRRILLVWETEDAAAPYKREVMAKIISSNGDEVMAPFRVNELQVGDQYNPKALATSDGGFVIFWSYKPVYTYSGRPKKQRFNSDFEKIGDQQMLNDVWQSAATSDSGYFDLKGRRYFTRHYGEQITIDVLANDSDHDISDDRRNLSIISSLIREDIGSVSVEQNKLKIDLRGMYDNLPPSGTDTLHIDYVVSDDSGATSNAVLILDIVRPSILFSDDFEQVRGWAVDPYGSDSASFGAWEIGDPAGSITQLDDTVSGANALVTGAVNSHLIGRTTVRSDEINLPNDKEVELSLWYSLSCYRSSFTESFTIKIESEGEESEIYRDDCKSEDPGPNGDYNTQSPRWRPIWLDLSAYRNKNIRIWMIAYSSSGAFDVAVDDVKVVSRNLVIPTINIVKPIEGDSYADNVSIELNATATDIDNSDISSSIIWESNLDGYLGTGDQLIVDNLRLGTHVISTRVSGENGTHNLASTSIEIYSSSDILPPVVIPPADLVVEATALQTPVVLGTASASDDVDGALTPVASDTGPFSVGVHTITWSATDAAGNIGTATQTVTVQDSTAPVLSVPADVSVTAAVPATVDIGTATATDIFGVTITNDAPSTFNEGMTVVTWTATDANGNSSTGTQNVSVTVPATGTTTIMGTNSAETLNGTEGDDIIVGGGGNDTMYGNGGNDVFVVEGTNQGYDTFYGGDGFDTILGGAGDDVIWCKSWSGDNGIERIDGGAGFNIFEGSYSCTDIDLSNVELINIAEIQAGNNHNNVTGTANNDVIVGGKGDDTLNGGAGDDTFIVEGSDQGSDNFYGGDGFDTILGGDGDDVIWCKSWSGDNGIERIDGGAGFNIFEGSYSCSNIDLSNVELINIAEIHAGDNHNNVTGTANNDIIVGGKGNDTLNGGAGDDTFVVEGTDQGYDRFYGGDGFDTILGGDSDDVIGCKSWSTDNGIERIDGGAGFNIFEGNYDCKDIDLSNVELINIAEIHAGNNHDKVTGTSDNDIIVGGKGDDTLNGGAGDDTFIVDGSDQGSDKFYGGEGFDTILGGDGDDVIRLKEFGQSNSIERIDGGSGFNVIQTYTYGAVLNLSQVELINIAELWGNDSPNRDTIIGTPGNDVIVGKKGNDTLQGNEGDDTYVLYQGDGSDTIIDSVGLVSGTVTGGVDLIKYEDSITPNDLWFSMSGNDLVVYRLWSGDKITIKNWSNDIAHPIEQFTANNSILNSTDVQALIDAMSGYQVSSAGEISLTPEQQQVIDAAINAAWQ